MNFPKVTKLVSDRALVKGKEGPQIDAGEILSEAEGIGKRRRRSTRNGVGG